MGDYYGRHSCKQFTRGIPILFVYKVWCVNTPNGYLLKFVVYQGKIPHCNEKREKKFGKAASRLVRMIDEFSSDVKLVPFIFNLATCLPA
jgi:hypothetical protein